MRLLIQAFIVSAMFLVSAGPAWSETVTVVSFNVESGGDTNPSDVAADMRRITGVDLWGLSEVDRDPAARPFLSAAKTAGPGKFRYMLSRSGGSDRLAIIYNTERFDLLETQELHKLRYRSNGVLSNNMRGQLAARFRIKATGQEFVFAVNHLKCCGSGVDFRVKQVADIKDWAESLSVPAIVVGDFNTPVSPDIHRD